MAPGYIFIGAEPSAAAANPVQGPEILDEQGRIVWFSLLPAGQVATDFRVQTYEGNPVLTWAQSSSFGAGNPVTMNGYILDNTYTVVASVQASGFNGDQHEFQLTPQNTALLVIYAARQADLSSIGGPSDGYVTEGVVQEIDIATGALLFEWHSLDHVPPSESHAPVPASAPITAPYDYFHINSAKLDTDGNLLISSRHTWTVYKVNRTTGDVIWRLGGKSSSFAMGPGAAFAWQHDAEAVDSSTIRIFDNESNGAAVLPYTRVIFLHHDDTAMTATLSESITHPDQLSVLAEGSAQSLDNGDTFVEWGFLGRYSEFGPTGQLLYDVAEAPGYSSYRGYHQVWSGAPSGSPTGIALTNDDGSLLVHAIWNGATQVATWEVLGGATAGTLSTIASAPWNGFNTTVKAPGGADVVQVVALDSSGNVIGTSAPATGPFPYVFRTQPESQAIAPGGTIVFRAAAAGPVPAYQWMFNGGPLADGSANGASVSGAATSTLMIRGATPADAGSYTCVASRLGNTATTDPAILTVATTTDMGRLTNISCRSAVGPGFGNLILGFAITGQDASAPESLLVRASGPALAQLGVTGDLPDPQLQLFGQDGVVAANSDWGGDPAIASEAAKVGAFPWSDASSMDAALAVSLAPGSFSVVISDADGDDGVALGEVYDATPAGTRTQATPRLNNISGRAEVGTGDNVLIAGFVIGGSTSETVLIRGSGPALAQFGVSGALTDPALRLNQSNGDGTSTLLGTNAGWNGGAQIAAVAASVGAFAWGSSASADSAILITLPPGAYTAEISGASGDTGVSLIEVYEVP